MRILLVRLGAFGDIVHTLPLADDLAAAGHRIGWLCEDRWCCLLEGSAAVERVHHLPRRVLRSGTLRERLSALGTLASELRTTEYDAVIDAQGLAKSARAAWISGAALRLGHARPRAREGSWFVSQRRAVTRTVHVIDQQRDLGRLLGIDPAGPWRFRLPAWSAEHAWAAAWLEGARLRSPWTLNVGAGWPTKVWPVERQISFARLLHAAGIPLLVAWGSAAERMVAEQVVDRADHGILAPPTTIPQLAGLLARSAAVISGDTGPLHLALAIGTPAVGLFGPVPAERNGPRGPAYRNLQAPGAAWERKDLSRVDMGAIMPQEVLHAVHECRLADGLRHF